MYIIGVTFDPSWVKHPIVKKKVYLKGFIKKRINSFLA